MYFCEIKEFGNIVNKLKELVMRIDFVFFGSFSKGLELVKRMYEKIKGNILNIL